MKINKTLNKFLHNKYVIYGILLILIISILGYLRIIKKPEAEAEEEPKAESDADAEEDENTEESKETDAYKTGHEMEVAVRHAREAALLRQREEVAAVKPMDEVSDVDPTEVEETAQPAVETKPRLQYEIPDPAAYAGLTTSGLSTNDTEMVGIRKYLPGLKVL